MGNTTRRSARAAARYPWNARQSRRLFSITARAYSGQQERFQDDPSFDRADPSAQEVEQQPTRIEGLRKAYPQSVRVGWRKGTLRTHGLTISYLASLKRAVKYVLFDLTEGVRVSTAEEGPACPRNSRCRWSEVRSPSSARRSRDFHCSILSLL